MDDKITDEDGFLTEETYKRIQALDRIQLTLFLKDLIGQGIIEGKYSKRHDGILIKDMNEITTDMLTQLIQ